MALQPIDRKNAKHLKKVSVRKIPALVNRANKLTIVHIVPLHLRNVRFGFGHERFWRHEYYDMYD